ncbi:acyloxyacyl hydrolase [Algoriphagus taiwanensis]|uniref:Lipid A 3-O-deacylase PagL n=1 Tax=Algoriphagus taiwanensis TaxID=1445656 RepID=A0ABQ6PXI7_9BACT|nr:hypothetical protein Ataiwa_09330 [Algoriphagus taiwanensis]
MKTSFLIGIFLLAFSFGVKSQEGLHRFGVEGQYGWIIAHNPELEQVAQSSPVAIGISSQWLKNTRKNWEACNCFHYLGLSLSVVDFQNPKELGQAWNLAGTFEPNLFQKRKWAGSLATGLGVSYLTRVYDPIENPRNTFFSAPISFLIFLTPKISYQLAENWAMQASFSYSHISNGGQRQPNRGMNFPMLGLGILHYTRQAELKDFEKSEIPKSWEFYLDLGFNTQDAGAGSRQPNFTLAGGVFRRLVGILGMGGGLEIAKDFSIDVEKRIEATIPAAFVEPHLLFGRFDFAMRYAGYLYKPEGYQEDKEFYQRYTLNYFLGKNFRIGAGLKAHGHVAEYLDFRLGWRF